MELELNNYLINSPEKINKLKFDLMRKTTKASKYDIKTLSSIYNQFESQKTGPRFEDNINQTLKLIYGWQPMDIPRKFDYRKINYQEMEIILIENRERQVMIDDEQINFYLDKSSLYINYMNEKEGLILVDDEEIEYTLKKNYSKIIIGKKRECEVDGIYYGKSADFSNFNSDEIEYIFTNANTSDMKKYQNVIVEIKLSQNKTKSLIEQITRDRMIFDNLLGENNLYIGFVNKGDNYILNEDIIGDMNFILLGIKNNIFSGRDMRSTIDWETVKNQYDIISNLNSKFNILFNEMKKLREALDKKDEKKRLSSSVESKNSKDDGVGVKKTKKERQKSYIIRSKFLRKLSERHTKIIYAKTKLKK